MRFATFAQAITNTAPIVPISTQSVLAMLPTIVSLSGTNAGATRQFATASRWGQRFGERRMVVVAAFGLGLVMASMTVGALTTSIVAIALALPLSGWAFGHAQPGLTSAMGHAVDERDFGLATSLQQTANQIGAVVGIGLFTRSRATPRPPARSPWSTC